MPRFRIRIPPRNDVEIDWDYWTVTLGSDPENDLQIQHPEVSAFQALIRFHSGRGVCLLWNLDPEHPLQVNGAPASACRELADEDEIKIGPITLIYSPNPPCVPPPAHAVIPEADSLRPVITTAAQESSPSPYGRLLQELEQLEAQTSDPVTYARAKNRRALLEACAKTGRGQELQLALECAALLDQLDTEDLSPAAREDWENLLANHGLRAVRIPEETPWDDETRPLATSTEAREMWQDTFVSQTNQPGWMIDLPDCKLLIRPAIVSLKTS